MAKDPQLLENFVGRQKTTQRGLSMKTKSKRAKAGAQAHLKLKGQKLLKIDGSGGLLSSLGGLLVAAKLAEESGLLEKAAALIPAWRDEDLVDFEADELFKQRSFLAISGYPDAIDCSKCKNDPALKSVLGKAPDGPPLASQSTHTRMEQGMSAQTVKVLEGVFLDFFFEQHKHEPRELTIIADGLAVRTYGAQQYSTYRGGKKYSQHQYFPLIATTDGGWLLLAKLRKGGASDGKAVAIIQELVLDIKARWSKTALTLRMDAGFNSPELLDFLDEEGIDYECGYPCTFAIQVACKDVFAEAEKAFRKKHGKPRFVGKDGDKQYQEEHIRIRSLPVKERMKEEKALASRRVRIIAEIMHLGDNWDKERRVIVRVDFDDRGLKVRCVVTSRKHGLAQSIYEDDYCKRSRVEMFVKENKSHCRVPLSCQEFTANQFRFVAQGLAYTLLHLMRLQRRASQPNISIAGTRDSLLLVPVLIDPTPRRLHWRLSSVHPSTPEVIHMIWRLEAKTA